MQNDFIPYPWRVASIRGGRGRLVVGPGGELFTCMKTVAEFLDTNSDITWDEKHNFSAMLGLENRNSIKSEPSLKQEKDNNKVFENVGDHKNGIKREKPDHLDKP